jgi:hypothetical protein
MKSFLVVVFVVLASAGSLVAQSTNFGKNKVQYSPFHWRYIQSPHFDIYFYDGGEELAAFTAERAEIALVSIEHTLRYDLGNRVSILI